MWLLCGLQKMFLYRMFPPPKTTTPKPSHIGTMFKNQYIQVYIAESINLRANIAGIS